MAVAAPAAVDPRPHGWTRPASFPSIPGPGSVHVWRADLSPQESETPPQRLLCEEERARAARIADPLRAGRWARGRAILRLLLGGYLEREPGTLRFELRAHGKPALYGSELEFNLAHSGHLALYALSTAGAVGIDVELPRPKRFGAGFAERILSTAEARRIERLPENQRERELLRAWVRREAAVKRSGIGIGGYLQPPPGPWSAPIDLDAGPGVVAALACEEPLRELSALDWPLLP